MCVYQTLLRQHEDQTLVEVRDLQVTNLEVRRQLVFDHSVVQSEIIRNKPEILALALHQYFLAGQLFAAHPKHVLLAGLGGGALARYFAQQFPNTNGVAVEISPLVCEVTKSYFEFPGNKHWQIVQQSIQDYVSQSASQYDLIIVDIADGLQTPQWLTQHAFLSALKNRLSPQGHIVFNLLGDDMTHIKARIQAIRQAFKSTTACLAVPNSNNVVMYAYREKPTWSAKALEARLDYLTKQWGLPFAQYYQEMQTSNPKDSGIF